MKTDQQRIVVEVSLPVAVQHVWAALTEPSKMTQWFFEEIGDFRPEVGFEAHFIVTNQDRDFDHRWLIQAV